MMPDSYCKAANAPDSSVPISAVTSRPFPKAVIPAYKIRSNSGLVAILIFGGRLELSNASTNDDKVDESKARMLMISIMYQANPG